MSLGDGGVEFLGAFYKLKCVLQAVEGLALYREGGGVLLCPTMGDEI